MISQIRRAAFVFICLAVVGCTGPDFQAWSESGREFARTAGATATRVERLKNSRGTMLDDDASHVEIFATMSVPRDEAVADLQAAGAKLGYTVTEGLVMSRPGSCLIVSVPEAVEPPIPITIMAVGCP